MSDRPVDDTTCLSHLFDDERPWPSHGQFVQHVTQIAQEARAAGHINARDRAQLVSAAAGSWSGD